MYRKYKVHALALSGKRGHGHADMKDADMENAGMENAGMDNADMENATWKTRTSI